MAPSSSENMITVSRLPGVTPRRERERENTSRSYASARDLMSARHGASRSASTTRSGAAASASASSSHRFAARKSTQRLLSKDDVGGPGVSSQTKRSSAFFVSKEQWQNNSTAKALSAVRVLVLCFLLSISLFTILGFLYAPLFTTLLLCTAFFGFVYLFAEETTILIVGRQLEECKAKRRRHILRFLRRALLHMKDLRAHSDEGPQIVLGVMVLLTVFLPSDSPINSADSLLGHPAVLIVMILLMPVIVFSYAAIIRESSLLKHAASIRSTRLATPSAEVKELNAEIQRLLVERDYFTSSKVSYFASFFFRLFKLKSKGPSEQENKIRKIFADEHEKLLLGKGDTFNALVQNCDLEILLDRLPDRNPTQSMFSTARNHGGGSRTMLIRFLCFDAVDELTVRSRVLIINALQVLKFSCSPDAEEAVMRILLNTLGDDLSNLKSMTDSKGSIHGFWKLVFADLSVSKRAQVQRHILQQSTLQVYTRLVHRDEHLRYLLKKREEQLDGERDFHFSEGAVGRSGGAARGGALMAGGSSSVGGASSPVNSGAGLGGVNVRQRATSRPRGGRFGDRRRMLEVDLPSESDVSPTHASASSPGTMFANKLRAKIVDTKAAILAPPQPGGAPCKTPLSTSGAGVGTGTSEITPPLNMNLNTSPGRTDQEPSQHSGPLDAHRLSNLSEMSVQLQPLASIGEDAQYYLSNDYSPEIANLMNMSPTFQGLHARHQWFKILTDIDDTLYASGGNHIAGVDKRYPRKQIYPGVTTFYRVLEHGDAPEADDYRTDRWWMLGSSLGNRVTPTVSSRWRDLYPQLNPERRVVQEENAEMGRAHGSVRSAVSAASSAGTTPAQVFADGSASGAPEQQDPANVGVAIPSKPASPKAASARSSPADTGKAVASAADAAVILPSSPTGAEDKKLQAHLQEAAAKPSSPTDKSLVPDSVEKGKHADEALKQPSTDSVLTGATSTDQAEQESGASTGSSASSANGAATNPEDAAFATATDDAALLSGTSNLAPSAHSPAASASEQEVLTAEEFASSSSAEASSPTGVRRRKPGPLPMGVDVEAADDAAEPPPASPNLLSSPQIGATVAVAVTPDLKQTPAGVPLLGTPAPHGKGVAEGDGSVEKVSGSSPPLVTTPSGSALKALLGDSAQSDGGPLKKTTSMSSAASRATTSPTSNNNGANSSKVSAKKLKTPAMKDDNIYPPPNKSTTAAAAGTTTAASNDEDDSDFSDESGSDDYATDSDEEYSSNEQNVLEGNFGHLVGFSARPHIVSDYIEAGLFASFQRMMHGSGLHCMPALLPGGIVTATQFLWHGDYGPLGEKKFENFLQYQSLYPEFKFIFIGDNGQADYYTATKMLDRCPEVVECVYIHVVQEKRRTYGYRKSDVPKKVCFFEDYIDAAMHACSRQRIISPQALWMVAMNVVNEFEKIDFSAVEEMNGTATAAAGVDHGSLTGAAPGGSSLTAGGKAASAGGLGNASVAATSSTVLPKFLSSSTATTAVAASSSANAAASANGLGAKATNSGTSKTQTAEKTLTAGSYRPASAVTARSKALALKLEHEQTKNTRQKEVERLNKQVDRVNAFLQDLQIDYLPKIRAVHDKAFYGGRRSWEEVKETVDAETQTDADEMSDNAKKDMLATCESLEEMRRQMNSLVANMEKKVTSVQETVRSTVMQNNFLRVANVPTVVLSAQQQQIPSAVGVGPHQQPIKFDAMTASTGSIGVPVGGATNTLLGHGSTTPGSMLGGGGSSSAGHNTPLGVSSTQFGAGMAGTMGQLTGALSNVVSGVAGTPTAAPATPLAVTGAAVSLTSGTGIMTMSQTPVESGQYNLLGGNPLGLATSAGGPPLGQDRIADQHLTPPLVLADTSYPAAGGSSQTATPQRKLSEITGFQSFDLGSAGAIFHSASDVKGLAPDPSMSSLESNSSGTQSPN